MAKVDNSLCQPQARGTPSSPSRPCFRCGCVRHYANRCRFQPYPPHVLRNLESSGSGPKPLLSWALLSCSWSFCTINLLNLYIRCVLLFPLVLFRVFFSRVISSFSFALSPLFNFGPCCSVSFLGHGTRFSPSVGHEIESLQSALFVRFFFKIFSPVKHRLSLPFLPFWIQTIL